MKKIAMTMGEPGGIGPEVVLKSMEAAKDICIPVVTGDSSVMEEAAKLIERPLNLRVICSAGEARAGVINLIETGTSGRFKKGSPTKDGGRASVSAIEKAVELAVNKEVDALVTAPISKEALRMAGLKWPGHTEMLAELTGTKDYAMMLVGEAAGFSLRVILATTHVAIKKVPALITEDAVSKTIGLAVQACKMLSIDKPRIAVAGLNPHAGEAGMFGEEEKTIIEPAIKGARKRGVPVTGPYPPDTVFNRASKGEFDIVVCMYHDQGLIPLKLLAFDTGVNVTVGLPIIRTSPDHGTAYGIAWKGMANPASMIEAIKLAARLKRV